MLSKNSAREGKRLKGLETIYLKRLDPTAANTKKPPKKVKPKTRVMQDRFHDEAEFNAENDWNNDRDELTSLLSDNFNQMEKQHFDTQSVQGIKFKRQIKKDGLFIGNFNKYKKE